MKPLMFALSFIAFAGKLKSQNVQANLPTAVIETITETTAFFAEDPQAGKVVLHIYNPKENKLRIILYKDGMRFCYKTSAARVRKSFDFANADHGVYSLTVFEGKKFIQKKITILPPAE